MRERNQGQKKNCRFGMPSAASPRHRARCDRHEARAGIVTHSSCCLARLGNGDWALVMRSLSHHLRARRELLATVPLLRAALTRRLSVAKSAAAAKLCYLLYSTKHPLQIQNLSVVHATQRHPRKTSSPLASAFPWLPRCVAHDFFLQSRELRRVWSRLLILCCDPTTVTCLCSQNATVQACMHTATPRLDSRAFAVAEGEDRDKLETDVHGIAVRKASGAIHGHVA